MRILVIGGTYFLGKAFVELANNGSNEILLVNRGSRESCGNKSGRVRSFLTDRHDKSGMKRLSELLENEKVDVVVDFCAYEKGDISSMMEALPKDVRQYIFLSTCDVYQRGTGEALDENAPFEERQFGGQEGAYISGKVALEKEVRQCAVQRGIHYTSIRPTIIYGPGNYAPREGLFFHWISKAGQILLPEDADGYFQMVYVKDVAACIYACLLREDCYESALNICGDDILDYQGFADALEKACGQGNIERIELPVADIQGRGIPFPFALMKEESECYKGERVKKLGVAFTPLAKGLCEAYAEYLRSQA